MNCKWGYDDCLNLEKKCYLCVQKGYHLLQNKPSKVYTNTLKIKNTKRMGAISEVKSYTQTKQALDTAVAVTGTPNSGAGHVKGDIQIRGLINVMEELKTTTKKNLNKEPGKESFTIQRAWLEKLEREAKAENMEFQYLKFSFKEQDDRFYCVTENDHILDMIVTMKHDRIKLKKIELEFDIYKKRTTLVEAENAKLRAEIELLKTEKEYLKDEITI